MGMDTLLQRLSPRRNRPAQATVQYDPPHSPMPPTVDDAGMVTVEAALAYISLMVVLVGCLAGFGAGITQLRLTDAAHTVARSVSRGETPPGAEELRLPSEAHIHITTTTSLAQVQIEAPATVLPLTLHAQASMPLERIAE